MKTMIAHEVERKGLAANIKLGPGGIREVEFIGQIFQLIRGGREPELQERGILAVLAQLGADGTSETSPARSMRLMCFCAGSRTACRRSPISRSMSCRGTRTGMRASRSPWAMTTGAACHGRAGADSAQAVQGHFERCSPRPRRRSAHAGDSAELDALWSGGPVHDGGPRLLAADRLSRGRTRCCACSTVCAAAHLPRA